MWIHFPVILQLKFRLVDGKWYTIRLNKHLKHGSPERIMCCKVATASKIVSCLWEVFLCFYEPHYYQIWYSPKQCIGFYVLDEILKRINMKAYREEHVDTISGYFAVRLVDGKWYTIRLNTHLKHGSPERIMCCKVATASKIVSCLWEVFLCFYEPHYYQIWYSPKQCIGFYVCIH